MIEVTLFENNKGITAFEISGHADSGPYGYDLVCAGVSAVSFGSVNAIIAISGVEPEIVQQDDGGYLHVSLPADAIVNTEIQTILKAMVISLETIENEYHPFLKINKK